ncbi:MAG: hypothetical protein IT160_01720 [Bryobacterales bacterium]|nr:hypothetical protein [Bryobacterales bacterium]
MQTDLNHALNDAVVRRLAGERVYRSGDDYYRRGRVETIISSAPGIRAAVRGSANYSVHLTSDKGILQYACDCPQGASGAFCKHCVAAALQWLDQSGATRAGKRRRKVKEPTLEDAARILQDTSKDTLLRMMLDWARSDDRVRDHLIQYAARQVGPDCGAAAAARAFDEAVGVDCFVHYREAAAWARGVGRAIDCVSKLLEDGGAAAAMELCESALGKLVNAAGAIDDSDGHIAVLRDRLHDIHWRACQQARPDPVALARRLFEAELHSGLDVFHGAVEQYAEILGDEGLKQYRLLAEAEWQKVPARTAEDRSDWGEYFRITHIMESLARTSGDTEQLVAVMSRDLSHPYEYFRIAEVYREAGKSDKALEWAEEGLKAFPKHTDPRLRELAVEEYHRRKRHADAIKLMWEQFAERPYLEAYRTLQSHASRSGDWPQWRERALSEIRLQIANAKLRLHGGVRHRWDQPQADHSQLVAIFLYERDTDAAWREAQAGGCSANLWLQLAAEREKQHPADVVPIYMQHAEADTQSGRYEDAIELLVKAAAAMKRLSRGAEFVLALEALRVKYKIKRNFIKLLEQKRDLLYLT